jgi:hypothetical protein
MFYQDTASEPAHRAKLDHPLAELVSIPTKPQIIEYCCSLLQYSVAKGETTETNDRRSLLYCMQGSIYTSVPKGCAPWE